MPILFASYAGVLGGAERVLLDCATRLERPLRVACPDGPLADGAARGGRSTHAPLEDRGLKRSSRPAPRGSPVELERGCGRRRSSPGARGR